jgi:hypothetical protein
MVPQVRQTTVAMAVQYIYMAVMLKVAQTMTTEAVFSFEGALRGAARVVTLI